LAIENVDVDTPIDREILVRTGASGVCHSDVHFIDGFMTMKTPAVLGHEAAGVVEQVGPNVTYVKPGDRVIACLSVFCGHCANCLSGRPNLCPERFDRTADQPSRLSQGGEPVVQLARIGGYAEMMLLHENGVVKIDEDIAMDRAALIGCAVTTGLGAVLNTAKIEAGCTVAVFGTGGVGLSAIQGARISGARMIIAIDVNEAKLATAMELGATHIVDASGTDPVEAIHDLTGGGVDYSFEAIGLTEVDTQAFNSVRPGGTATIIGILPMGQKIEIAGHLLLKERKLQGSSMGSNRFRIDIPKYIDFYRQGTLKLDEMITRRGRLEDINEAIRAMKAREVARSVLMFD
jgi:S-(hydroxymethyl)glutathione dehydrogenase/alcohol dehydrogenase